MWFDTETNVCDDAPLPYEYCDRSMFVFAWAAIMGAITGALLVWGLA